MESFLSRRWTYLMLAALWAPGLVWLGVLWVRTLRPLPPMPQPAGRVTTWSDTGWSHIPADGERCILANNIWNKHAAAYDFEQEVFQEDLNGKTTLGWRWRSPWQMWPSIAAYPEIICGNKPWDEPIGHFDGMPFHPDKQRVSADYDIHLKAAGAWNLAFSLWAVSDLPGAPDNIRTEVMIWIASNQQKPSGIRRGTLDVDGVTYDIYVNEHQHDASGANKNEWTYVAFVARTPVLRGPLDISAFLDALAPQKIITPELWITDVELGDEVAEGAGMAEVQDFQVHLTAPTQLDQPLPGN